MLRNGVWLSEAHFLELREVYRPFDGVQQLVELEVFETHIAQLGVGVLPEHLRHALEDGLGHNLSLQVQRSQPLVIDVWVVWVFTLLFFEQSIIFLTSHSHLFFQRAFERALVLDVRTSELSPQKADD